MFDPKHKKERHETVFPEDKKKAFALGEQAEIYSTDVIANLITDA